MVEEERIYENSLKLHLFWSKSRAAFMTLCIPASALHKGNGTASDDDAGSGHVIRGANHISSLVVLYSVFSSFLQKRSPID